MGKVNSNGMTRVEIHLAGGIRHRVEIEADSPVLTELLEIASATTPGLPPRFLQLPLDGGRAALSFSSRDLLGLKLTPAVAEASTARAAACTEPLPIHDMEVARTGRSSFFLFLDIFVHPSRDKVVAVAPYYGDDWDPASHGVDFEHVYMDVARHRIRARYIHHRLDTYEPCVLFDFEDPALAALLQERDEVAFTITVGPHSKSFTLTTRPAPAWNVAMSLVVKDENRWLRTFLEYYLSCLEVEHVFVYDNGTAERDTLLSILRPYQERRRVTYVPWDYRWRNRKDRHMIGQPPQEAHSLNRFANCRWIGFFDIDELLRIPGRTLPQFLAEYEVTPADGLSFGLRWFDYCGPKGLDEIADPPLTFLHSRRDELGRKRKKLIVAPRAVRFLRLHWLEENKRELAIDDTDIFFHHYSLQGDRLENCKTKPAVYDDFMLQFADRLVGLSPATRTLGNRPAQTAPIQRPTSADEWRTHVLAAIEAAETGQVELPAEVLAIEGMCGTFTLRFYNRLCAFEGCRYLEIGSLHGASTCAAIYGNRVAATCIDNWSLFGGSRARFEETVRRFRGDSTVRLIERDCFAIDTEGLGPFDVYLYDGGHSRQAQYRALEHFAGALAPIAAVIIDDWNWEHVRQGTREALADLRLDVLFEKEIRLRDADVADMPRHCGRHTWWNGICVLLLAERDGP